MLSSKRFLARALTTQAGGNPSTPPKRTPLNFRVPACGRQVASLRFLKGAGLDAPPPPTTANYTPQIIAASEYRLSVPDCTLTARLLGTNPICYTDKGMPRSNGLLRDSKSCSGQTKRPLAPAWSTRLIKPSLSWFRERQKRKRH